MYITHMHRKNVHPRKGDTAPPGLRGRIWIDGKEGTFLGYGRIILLERIREYGSITNAAKSMEMSYRHAWELVDSMNRQAGKPLVEASTGGKGGGGARLTEDGEKAISLFWKFYEDFQAFLGEEEGKLGFSDGRKRRFIKGDSQPSGGDRRRIRRQ
jgi:molybdate transport system regulatory protein